MDDSLLRRLSGKPVARRYAVIDIESRHWVEPYAVGFYDGATFNVFTDYTYSYKAIDAALRHVLQPQYNGFWIYAHNGGNYDFTFFLRHIIVNPEWRKKYSVDITPIGSTVVRFDVIERVDTKHKADCSQGPKCRGCDQAGALRWTFVDSVRLMPMPLDEIGETFNIGRKVELKMSYDELAKPGRAATMTHYLKGDCTLLYSAIGKMQTVINGLGGQLGVTLPATALDTYRRKYQAEDILTNRHWIACPEYGKERKKGERAECKNCLHEFIRRALFGGRTEIYRMSFKPYTDANGLLISHALMYDVNAHYPHCMLEPMPTGLAIELEGIEEADVYTNARRMVGFVDCDVYVPKGCYLPPLPVRSKGGKLIFPTGKFSGTWDAVELLLLKRVGGKILKTRRSVWFDSSPVFVRFIRQMYKFRDKRLPGWTKGMDWIAKLLMNSSFGKWAMKEDRSRIIIRPDSPEGLKCISLESDVWSQDTFISPSYIVPQISAHVTALARARLWEILQGVIDQGGRIYYTDTDSVICSGVNLPTASDLGALKLEPGRILRAQFALPKLYLIETDEPKTKAKRHEKNVTIRAKGMGPGIRMPGADGEELGDDPLAGQLSEKEFVDLVRRGVPIARHRIQKLKEGLNEYAKKATMFPRVVASKKQMQSKYDKRIIVDGHDTVAINL